MPAKPSGQIKTSVIKKPQKNGDTYILERRTIYDPEKKYTKVLSTKLIAKIPKGSEIPVPTRPKRGKNSIPDTKTQIVSAKRDHIGMMDIIGHIGSTSGIDNAIYSSTDLATAQKVISLARYLLAALSAGWLPDRHQAWVTRPADQLTGWNNDSAANRTPPWE